MSVFEMSLTVAMTSFPDERFRAVLGDDGDAVGLGLTQDACKHRAPGQDRDPDAFVQPLTEEDYPIQCSGTGLPSLLLRHR